MGAMLLPKPFMNRMERMLGEEAFPSFLASYEMPPARALRLNPQKLSPDLREELFCAKEKERVRLVAKRFPSMGDFQLSPVPWAQPWGFYYGGGEGIRPGKSPLHDAGLYYIQEPSAMAAAVLLDVKPGEKVLDLCAAPGSKASMLASMLRGQGILIANEIEPSRARILSQNIERMGLANVVVTNETPQHLSFLFPGFFDRVLVDAPCSGEGMFKKEPDALSMWSMDNIRMCAQRQSQILESAAVMVKIGGSLLYSTCTFSLEENESCIEAFLGEHPDFSLVDLPKNLGKERMDAYGFSSGLSAVHGNPRSDVQQKTIRLLPHLLKGEGHFIALLKRGGESYVDPLPPGRGLDLSLPAGSGKRRRAKQQGREDIAVTQKQELAATAMKELLSENITEKLSLSCGAGAVAFGDALYLMPYRDVLPMQGLKILRPGLQLGTFGKGRFEPAQALAMALTENAVQSMDFPSQGREIAAYLRGETLSCDPKMRGWVLVLADGVSLGWGKASGGVVRNHYPKGLRRNIS